MIDVYGNSTAIEFIDMRQQLNNSRRNTNPSSSCDNTPDEVDRLIVPSMQSMNIAQEQQEELPMLRYQPAQLVYHPVAFHRTRGRNVRFSHNRTVALRTDTEFCQGYVFTARPLMLNERIVVQIISTEPMYVGSLALGLTSCDPNHLQNSDLPDDSDLLLDRPEYWVVSKDFASSPIRRDEISFCVTHNGEVQISKNGRPPTVVMHVDQSLKLWAFLDIYGSTQRIRVLSCSANVSPARNLERRIISPTSSESMNSLNSQSEIRRNIVIQQASMAPPNTRVCSVVPTEMVQVQPSMNGGAVLVVNLPPAHANLINHQQSSPAVATASPHPHASQLSVHSQNSQHSSHPPSHHNSNSVHVSGPQSQSIHHSNGLPAAAIPSVSSHSHHQSSSNHQSSSTVAAPATGTMLSTSSNNYIEVSII